MTDELTMASALMGFKFFIFCWPGWERQALRSQLELVNRGCQVTVIASGASEQHLNWVDLPTDAFFGDQFRAAVERLGTADTLVHLQADAVITDPDRFLERLMRAFANERVGVWAPDVDYTTWTSDIVGLGAHSNAGFNLDEFLEPVVNTDCTCWAIRGDLVNEVGATSLMRSHLGWGIDVTVCALAFLRGYVVVRDNSVTVDHPRGTGYREDEAGAEWERLKAELPQDVQGAIALLLLYVGALRAKRDSRLTRRARRAAGRVRRVVAR